MKPVSAPTRQKKQQQRKNRHLKAISGAPGYRVSGADDGADERAGTQAPWLQVHAVAADTRSALGNVDRIAGPAQIDSSIFKKDSTRAENGRNARLPNLLVLVQSASRNTERRNAIRDTWASPTKGSSSGIRLGFVLGTPRKASLNDKVLREAYEYRDIIMSNFTESYYNLSLSTVTLLRWAVENCAGYDYLVKADDDAFLNLTALRKYLSDKPKKNSIFGYLMRGYRPNRQPKSKWYTPHDLYNKSRLPDFVSGFAYVITADVVPELYAAAKDIPMFPLEDVYVTGMCRERTRAVLRNAARFHNHKKKKTTSICSYANVLAQHEMTPAEMYTLWQKISNHGCD
ncbi:hypothetical protein HPB47_020270 [Ixodes persulcatus]|uniref:Uncharacterized protein n=1 Tax=Ixodes persulcatus TaxID=34615 RepID=A0AC60QFX5_IXOPE|nr:hypothetical protein HPB47_020270 [Ixodes persulcatus]